MVRKEKLSVGGASAGASGDSETNAAAATGTSNAANVQPTSTALPAKRPVGRQRKSIGVTDNTEKPVAIELNINQRPRRQIVHKYIRNSSYSISAAVDTSADDSELLVTTPEPVTPATPPITTEIKRKRGRPKKIIAPPIVAVTPTAAPTTSVIEIDNNGYSDPATTTPTSTPTIQLIEIQPDDESSGDVPADVDTCVVDSEQFELLVVEDESQSTTDNEPHDRSGLTCDVSLDSITVQQESDDTYLITVADQTTDQDDGPDYDANNVTELLVELSEADCADNGEMTEANPIVNTAIYDEEGESPNVQLMETVENGDDATTADDVQMIELPTQSTIDADDRSNTPKPIARSNTPKLIVRSKTPKPIVRRRSKRGTKTASVSDDSMEAVQVAMRQLVSLGRSSSAKVDCQNGEDVTMAVADALPADVEHSTVRADSVPSPTRDMAAPVNSSNDGHFTQISTDQNTCTEYDDINNKIVSLSSHPEGLGSINGDSSLDGCIIAVVEPVEDNANDNDVSLSPTNDQLVQEAASAINQSTPHTHSENSCETVVKRKPNGVLNHYHQTDDVLLAERKFAAVQPSPNANAVYTSDMVTFRSHTPVNDNGKAPEVVHTESKLAAKDSHKPIVKKSSLNHVHAKPRKSPTIEPSKAPESAGNVEARVPAVESHKFVPKKSSQSDATKRAKQRPVCADAKLAISRKVPEKKLDPYAILSDCYMPKQVKHDSSLYSISAMKAAKAESEAQALAESGLSSESAAIFAIATHSSSSQFASQAMRKCFDNSITQPDVKPPVPVEVETKFKTQLEAPTESKHTPETRPETRPQTPLVTQPETPLLETPPEYMIKFEQEESTRADRPESSTGSDIAFTDGERHDNDRLEIETPESLNTESDQSPDDRPTSNATDNDPETTAVVDEVNIRRSGRIRIITETKQRSRGFGLVRDKDRIHNTMSAVVDRCLSNATPSPTDSPDTTTENAQRTSTCGGDGEDSPTATPDELERHQQDLREGLALFKQIVDNEFRSERNISKEAKRMTCDCFLTSAEVARGEFGCGEDCLNRLLMIECGSRCVVGDRCTNKRFQRHQTSDCTIFKTGKKGFGLRAVSYIAAGDFIMEYVGEVLNSQQFEHRASEYAKEKNRHHYFMALRSDCVIDATIRGNISRFINHSCDPNAETQKWTVNGELRIGFFSTKAIAAGEEITFDYQFQRYGKAAQRCYCEAHCCRGWIGEEPDSDDEVEDEEEDDENDLDDVATDASVIQPSIDEHVGKDAAPNANAEPFAEQTAKDCHKKPQPKPQKPKKPAKAKRAEIMEDPDLDMHIDILTQSQLKNQAQTLRFSRLMVRAKLRQAKSQLLRILRAGELACRRLFLDYHGLKLLHAWMCDGSSDVTPPPADGDVAAQRISEWEFRLEILQTLAVLPILNKLLLEDSKVLQTVGEWSLLGPSEPTLTPPTSLTPEPEVVPKPATTTCDIPKLLEENSLIQDIGLDALKQIITTNEMNAKRLNDAKQPPPTIEASQPVVVEPIDELMLEIATLAKSLVSTWSALPEVFRIPKKQRIEQMKEHEREANRNYQALGFTESDPKDESVANHRNMERFRERERTVDRFRVCERQPVRHRANGEVYPTESSMSKIQRRRLFEEKVEAERRLLEQQYIYAKKCDFFRLNPHFVDEASMPFCVNIKTSQWFGQYGHAIYTPPSHHHFRPAPKNISTNPDDYTLPAVDLPEFWQYGIDPNGCVYYYHTKIRVPQWEPPIKLLPLLATDEPSATVSGDGDAVAGRSDGDGGTDAQDGSDTQAWLGAASSSDESDDGDELSMKYEAIEDALEEKRRLYENMRQLPDLLAEITALANGTEEPSTSANVFDPTEEDASDSELAELDEIVPHKRQKCRKNLMEERTISPRSDEDRKHLKQEMRRYRENKEKLRRQKNQSTKRKRSRSAAVGLVESKKHRLTDGLPVVMDDEVVDDEDSIGDIVAENDDDDDVDEEDDDEDDDNDGGDGEASIRIAETRDEADDLDVDCDEDGDDALIEEANDATGEDTEEAVPHPLDVFEETMVEDTTEELDVSQTESSRKGVKRKRVPLPPVEEPKPESPIPSDLAKRIKDKFRSNIAGVIVHNLSYYRRDTCPVGHITNDDDFRHLAKKLTHFVMLKELKHCDNTIDALEVNDSVRGKAKEFVRKYMTKFGPTYKRSENDPQYRDNVAGASTPQLQ